MAPAYHGKASVAAWSVQVVSALTSPPERIFLPNLRFRVGFLLLSRIRVCAPETSAAGKDE